jgi:hypothetical protein
MGVGRLAQFRYFCDGDLRVTVVHSIHSECKIVRFIDQKKRQLTLIFKFHMCQTYRLQRNEDSGSLSFRDSRSTGPRSNGCRVFICLSRFVWCFLRIIDRNSVVVCLLRLVDIRGWLQIGLDPGDVSYREVAFVWRTSGWLASSK